MSILETIKQVVLEAEVQRVGVNLKNTAGSVAGYKNQHQKRASKQAKAASPNYMVTLRNKAKLRVVKAKEKIAANREVLAKQQQADQQIKQREVVVTRKAEQF